MLISLVRVTSSFALERTAWEGTVAKAHLIAFGPSGIVVSFWLELLHITLEKYHFLPFKILQNDCRLLKLKIKNTANISKCKRNNFN